MDYGLLLARAKRRLHRLPIDEGFITAKRDHVAGLWEGDRIVINEAVLIVATLLHEALHDLHPRWGEKRVERETFKLMETLSDRQVRGIHQTYRRRRNHIDEIVDAEES